MQDAGELDKIAAYFDQIVISREGEVRVKGQSRKFRLLALRGEPGFSAPDSEWIALDETGAGEAEDAVVESLRPAFGDGLILLDASGFPIPTPPKEATGKSEDREVQVEKEDGTLKSYADLASEILNAAKNTPETDNDTEVASETDTPGVADTLGVAKKVGLAKGKTAVSKAKTSAN